jgi:diaminohydroxyphosphoribosylaminopyrimidine deaminase/5-amino-6-(5-phosphoribosylamino)uracil reductase
MTDIKDIAYLEMAYGLAEKARGWASPNPYVGAVVVRREAIIGYGYHERPGKPHAEAVALERAGRPARGSTLYITLEPCVHWGRTPPCADAVIRAGPKRVVVSSFDPNPLVFQKGIRKLRAAGIDVSVGLLKDRNVALNEGYIKHITRGIPFVTLKAALSLDGRTATRTRDSRWISSPLTRDYVHLLRGEQDAIMVGIQTILGTIPCSPFAIPSGLEKRSSASSLILTCAFRSAPGSCPLSPQEVSSSLRPDEPPLVNGTFSKNEG